VRRSDVSETSPRVIESRVVKLVDGKPAGDTSKLNSPASVFGIFSYGLRIVSSSNKDCFHYRMRPVRKGRTPDNIVIEFEELPQDERAAHCPYDPFMSGRATVKSSSMRVTRMEVKTRNYEVVPGVTGTWEWSIDYAPVQLSGKTFWMPAKIRSQATTDGAPDSIATNTGGGGRRGGGTNTITSNAKPALTYSVAAKYSDYHLLNVVSKIIIPGKDDGGEPEGKAEDGADPQVPPSAGAPQETVPGPPP